jgi:uncharacterized protein (TIGR00730 family)
MKKVCVFCGSSTGSSSAYIDAAQQLAGELVKRDIGLVYGGASIGIMGQIADAVLQAGGEVIGIIPESLADKEIAHRGLTELIVVDTMHQRKALMADRAQGFIAMPGGLGTLEELFEALTWSQLGIHRKPCGILNVGDYYQYLLSFIHHAVSQGFVAESHLALLLVEQKADRLLTLMENYKPPSIEKILRSEQR